MTLYVLIYIPMKTEKWCRTYIHFHIKSPWPEQSFIQVISPIGCTKNNHSFILMEAETQKRKVINTNNK